MTAIKKSMEIGVQAHYTRLFTDERGASCFEDLTTELQPGFSAPRLEQTILSAPFLATEGSFWLGAPTMWNGDDIPHPAPRRMILVTTQGEYQVTTSEGVVRRFPLGSVLVIEDTTGMGHSTRIISGDDVIIFAAGLSTVQAE